MSEHYQWFCFCCNEFGQHDRGRCVKCDNLDPPFSTDIGDNPLDMQTLDMIPRKPEEFE